VQGDKAIQEFDVLYQKYHDDIYKFLMKLTIYNSYLAEELTQETFYRVYLGIGSFKGKCHIKTWICQIAKNSYYLYIRKNRKTENFNVFSSVFDKVDPKSHISSTEETYENKEMINIMIKIINSFKEINQNVMIYRIFFNMPYNEISKLLGISEASAKVIYHRGKIVMQNKLRGDYGYEI
jgi:RNA polymerase sigma-70 factor (ECF subfamily)